MIASIVIKNYHDTALRILDTLITLLKTNGVTQIRCEQETTRYVDGLYAVTFPDLFVGTDVCFAIGGDGTIIHTAKAAAEYGQSVLGINAGRMGFMAALEESELGYLSRFFDGRFFVEERKMLEITTDGNRYYCLNDAVLSKGTLSKIIDIRVWCDGKMLTSFRGDGVIVATPTGSTAYNLSAGGPVIDPNLECLSITPICPHTLFTRPIVLKSDSKIEVQGCYGHASDGDVYLTVDGEHALKVTDRKIQISGSTQKKARLIRLKDQSFCEIFNHKITEKRNEL